MSNIQTIQIRTRSGLNFVTLVGLLCLVSCGNGTKVSAKSVSPISPVDPSAPVITNLTATPLFLTSGHTSILSWNSIRTSSCTLSISGSGTLGTFQPNDSYTTQPLSSSTTYTLNCLASSTNSTVKSDSRSVMIVVSSSLAGAAAACAAEPVRSGGSVHYYCDCGTGAQSGCVPGSDSNTGTDSALPRRTIGNAVTFLRSQAAVNDTVALCQGGAFNATGQLSPGSTRCSAGTTCNDLREYAPTTFSGTAKPVINNASGTVSLFYMAGNIGGVRILNLKLIGDHGSYGNRNRGFYFYNGAHDVTMCNVDMDAFDVAVSNESNNGVTNNIKLTGSSITNSRSMGFLGAGNNMELSYNSWDANGGSNSLDHTIYLGTSVPVSNLQVLGNHIHGQQGSTCLGSVITAHGQYDYLSVNGNQIDIDASANTNGGCLGIDINIGGYAIPIYFRHTTISNNTFTNTGNQAISIASCPGCIIENNLIIQNWSGASIGIAIPMEAARTSLADAANTANVIRNNTIYYGPNFVNKWGGATGIRVGTEGSGHIIANNTVYYSSSSAGTGFNCYAYSLTLSAYAFINNNHCYSADSSYSWVAGRETLAAWQTYSKASGFDTASFTGDPLFKAPGTDFTPMDGSPLIGKGNAENGSTYDITGKVRHSPPDIGAYEH